METETRDTTKSTQSTPPSLSPNEEKSTFQNIRGSTSTNNAFNFEISDSLREAIFNFLLGNSPIEAANFEYRTNPNFLQLLNKVNDNCRNLMLEKFKFINLSLLKTRSSGLRGQLEAGITQYPTLFEYVVTCFLETDIVQLCEVIEQIPSSVTSNILFLQVDDTDSYIILELLSFLFRKGHCSSFLYIDLDRFDLSNTWSTLVDSFRCISTLKSLAMTCRTISNPQLLMLLKILEDASLQSCYAIFDMQWRLPQFSDILDFLQRKRVHLKAFFDYLILQLSPTSDVPFEPLWMTLETSLDLACRMIDLNGVKYLSEALKENHTLTELDFHNNYITSEGAKYLSEALKQNHTLIKLDIGGNDITPKGAKYLSEALKENHTLTKLYIARNNITPDGAEFLSEGLKENQTLTELDIGTNNITSEGAKYLSEALKENQTLTYLGIGTNYITSEGAKYLSEALKENHTLTALDMYGNDIKSEGAKYLSEALKENHTLDELNIARNSITSEGAKYLSEALKENHTLTALDMYGNNITSEGAKYLSEALKENHTLTALSISGNYITSEGAKYLSEALKENHTLTILDIGYNNITSEGVIYLSEALKENQTLTELNIHGNDRTFGERLAFEIDRDLKRRRCELEEEANASNLNRSSGQSTLKTNRTAQHLRSSLKDASCLNQSYLEYKNTGLKEMNLLFILFMQHRRLEQQESSSHIPMYPPFEMMTYFIAKTSNSVNVRTQPKYFETEDYVCAICRSICTDPCCSENCSHVFCKDCIENWTESSCPTCRTVCPDWKVSPFAEKVILKLRLQCPHSCGWQGALIDYEQSHKQQCPNEMGECSSCHLEMKRSEFFGSHYGNCSDHLILCDYCHCGVPSSLLFAHIAHECALAPKVCNACHSFFSTWFSWKVHIEKECDKVF
ncbi:hypothetical protein GpartN1_g1703.t1 [Galdieria partita]|uniref:RING-type domain-containing protein n=1 Tax=Galdieria partita TaxID=83374 RepID=A0A9C7PUM4_9RHOD|nr:hypothetical protein GpartN1_g1703.t1 [Galdieria partita]